MYIALAGRWFPVSSEFDSLSYLRPVGSGNTQECINHHRVELGSTMVADFAAGVGVGHGCAIGPVTGDSIIGIGNGEDPGSYVNRLTSETVWIAGPVELFMMLTDYKPRRRQEIDVTDNLEAEIYMVLHNQPFFMG